jgi:hypothetical protein
MPAIGMHGGQIILGRSRAFNHYKLVWFDAAWIRAAKTSVRAFFKRFVAWPPKARPALAK